MRITNIFKARQQTDIPYIARVNLAEIQRERLSEEQIEKREVSLLAAQDYTKRLPKIRLVYASLGKFKAYDSNETKVGITIGATKTLKLPHHISYEDAYKIVSFVTDQVERENDLDECTEKGIHLTAKELEKYGFKVYDEPDSRHLHSVQEYHPLRKITTHFDELEKVKDLFNVNGDIKLFKKSELYPRYFDWYTEGLTAKDIKKIYKENKIDYILENTSEFQRI